MRKSVFKNIQKLQKGKFFENITYMERNYGTPSPLKNKKEFQELVDHAVKTTVYYKDYKNYQKLNEFPIINKTTLKENYNDFLSNKYNREDLIETKTSGSYGTPFTFLFTKEKKELQRSEVTFFSRWANFDIGIRHGLITSKPNKSVVASFIHNQYYVFPQKINWEHLEKESEKIKKKKLKVLLGYSSILNALAKHFIAKNDFYKLEGVVSISEVLTEDTRKNVEKAFGVVPLSRYTTEELGVLAMECPAKQKHHLNNVSFIIEVLDERNAPVEPGEQGEVIVTDLNSHAMPLIRYRTGDLAILGQGQCGCGLETPYLESIVGRVVEVIYGGDGNALSSFLIIHEMVDVKGVRQYQFIQTGKSEYTLKIVKSQEDIEALEIEKRMKKVLGQGAQIKLVYVEDIPPLKSGKRPHIIQKYYQN